MPNKLKKKKISLQLLQHTNSGALPEVHQTIATADTVPTHKHLNTDQASSWCLAGGAAGCFLTSWW